jgi:inorganic phosphate transporter, PiT family
LVELLVVTIVLALFFTFTNGIQDASSLGATFIASRSATPRRGIVLVASMDFLGAIFGGTAVAFTISGLISIDDPQQLIEVLMVALLAATVWNLVTWRFGLPSSSTHALIGGLVGASLISAGVGSIDWGWSELWGPNPQLVGLVKILVFLILSVIIGLVGGFLMHKLSRRVLRKARRGINRDIIRVNWAAAAIMAFSNGANDSQKQLGIIALTIFAAGGSATLDVPTWARITIAVLLGVGTLGGGWRIMRTLGNRIFKVAPVHSLDSQVSSGASIAFCTLVGAPVSSSQIIASSIIGVGAAENRKKVQWSVGKEVVIAMIVTIPGTMLVAAGCYIVLLPLIGV